MLDGGELNGLLDRLRKEVGYVDVMIDNGLAMVEELVDEVGATAAVASGADVRQFIDATSQRIRATINVSGFFVVCIMENISMANVIN